MIARQRKTHKIIWLFLTLAMGVFLVYTLLNLDFSSPTKAVPKEAVMVVQKGNQVIVTINEPLKSASSVIYELTATGKTGSVLGQINGIGSYAFTVNGSTKGVIILDRIKNQELFKTTF